MSLSAQLIVRRVCGGSAAGGALSPAAAVSPFLLSKAERPPSMLACGEDFTAISYRQFNKNMAAVQEHFGRHINPS